MMTQGYSIFCVCPLLCPVLFWLFWISLFIIYPPVCLAAHLSVCLSPQTVLSVLLSVHYFDYVC